MSENEKQLLQSLKHLEDKKKVFQKEFFNKAASCEILQNHRNGLKEQWDTTEAFIKKIESTVITDNPIYKFDVILSRDGILFLKDDTDSSFRTTYCVENTESDFTQNVPIHRLFKTAMNYIKFLFHKNYYHKDEDDTFLPATNLYPVRNSGKTEKIVKHQLESFLNPITTLKRGNFDRFICNPLGIIQYAESFLYVFENNGFIANDRADVLHKFIDKQKSDVEILLSENDTIIGSFLTQKNTLTTITVSVAFLLTTIEIFKFVSEVPEVGKFLEGIPKWLVNSIVLFNGFGIGYALKKITERKVLRFKRFVRENKSNSFFSKYSNSNIEKGKFSRLYSLRLKWIDVKLLIKEINRERIKGILLILMIILILLLVNYIYCRFIF